MLLKVAFSTSEDLHISDMCYPWGSTCCSQGWWMWSWNFSSTAAESHCAVRNFPSIIAESHSNEGQKGQGEENENHTKIEALMGQELGREERGR